MRSDVLSFVLGSENRKKIVTTLFDYSHRQWSCSALEDLTKISHGTVFRTLSGLRSFGLLKSVKVNKKDILYELVSSPLTKELARVLNIERIAAKKIAKNFIDRIASKRIYSAILYGSTVKRTMKPESDIDILIVLIKQDKILEEKIYNIAARLSSTTNKTVSVTIMDLKELDKENNSQFIKSVKGHMEIIYGKNPF